MQRTTKAACVSALRACEQAVRERQPTARSNTEPPRSTVALQIEIVRAYGPVYDRYVSVVGTLLANSSLCSSPVNDQSILVHTARVWKAYSPLQTSPFYVLVPYNARSQHTRSFGCGFTICCSSCRSWSIVLWPHEARGTIGSSLAEA